MSHTYFKVVHSALQKHPNHIPHEHTRRANKTSETLARPLPKGILLVENEGPRSFQGVRVCAWLWWRGLGASSRGEGRVLGYGEGGLEESNSGYRMAPGRLYDGACGVIVFLSWVITKLNDGVGFQKSRERLWMLLGFSGTFSMQVRSLNGGIKNCNVISL